MLKYSRQRESIKKNLMSRYDHPTAEMVYSDIRKEYPKVSLGTVYRNLSLLAELGEIQKITTGLGPDRFDGRTQMHGHFCCRKCGCVQDLLVEDQELLNRKAAEEFDGVIEMSVIQFYGLCGSCKEITEA